VALFNGTYVQNFDAKGRVSVPASFRVALRAGIVSLAAIDEGPVSIPLVLRPSDKAACIEAQTEQKHAALVAELEKLDPLGDAWPVETDREGRVIIPDALLSHAGISRSGAVAFVGMGTRFQLWQPENVAAHKAAQHSANRARATRPRDVAA
jgi:MraZ protein